MSESLPSNGSVADMKADKKSEADVSCQPHVSLHVSDETLMQYEIQLSADMTDMADIKKTTNSSNTSNKADEIPSMRQRCSKEPRSIVLLPSVPQE
jgi:hypothetical protein